MTDAVSISGDQITVTGTLISTGASGSGCPTPEVELAFESGTDPDLGVTGTFSNATPNSTTSPTAFSFTLSGVTPDTTYYFRAVAINEAGRSTGALLSVTTESSEPVSQVVNTLDYSTSLTSGGAFCWRGYAFQVSSPVTVTHIVGGANNTSNAGLFQGALFAGIQNSNGGFAVGSLLRQVTFPTTNPPPGEEGRVEVTLDEGLVLDAGVWYIIAQGRVGANDALHYFVDTFSAQDLVASVSQISDWQPQADNAFIFGCNQTTEDTVGITGSTTFTKPAVGFRFVSSESP